MKMQLPWEKNVEQHDANYCPGKQCTISCGWHARRNYDTNNKVFQTIVNILGEFKMSTSDAVNKTKGSIISGPGSDHGGKRTRTGKRSPKNMDINKRTRFIGRTEVVKFYREEWKAVADKRGDDAAVGFECKV